MNDEEHKTEREAKIAFLHREYPWTRFVEGPKKEAMIDVIDVVTWPYRITADPDEKT